MSTQTQTMRAARSGAEREPLSLGQGLMVTLVTLALAVSVGLALRVDDVQQSRLFVSVALILLLVALRAASPPVTRVRGANAADGPESGGTTATSTAAESSHLLIHGTFDGTDAEDVLFRLLDAKIEFHRRRCSSSMERYGSREIASERRIKELEATRADISKRMDEARKGGERIQIHSVVKLSTSPDPAKV